MNIKKIEEYYKKLKDNKKALLFSFNSKQKECRYLSNIEKSLYNYLNDFTSIPDKSIEYDKKTQDRNKDL